MGFRMQLQVTVLSRAQNAVHIGQEHHDGHEPRKFLQVDEITNLGGEFFIISLTDQAAKLNDPLLLLVRELRLRIVGLFIL
jgi:hypothetical protein